MKLGLAIRELHRSENDLRQELLQISDRHRTDHEVHYVARDLARWCADHVRDLSQVGRDYGEELDAEPEGESSLVARAREKTAELMGRRPEPSLLLLRDLREIYMKAAGVSIDWEMLAQAAQGSKQKELLALAERCHPDTLRQMRWANSKLKISSTQALVS